MLNLELLNNEIISKNLNVSKFDADGFACTLLDNSPFYTYVHNDGLMLYYLVSRLKEEKLKDPNLLLEILNLSTPSAKYPNIKLGIDKTNGILWLSVFKNDYEVNNLGLGGIFKDTKNQMIMFKNEILEVLSSKHDEIMVENKSFENNTKSSNWEDLSMSEKFNLLSI